MQRNNNSILIFEIIRGGGEFDWVGKEWAGLLFPQGKNGPAHSFPGVKTDWGKFWPVTPGHDLGNRMKILFSIFSIFYL